MTTTRVDGGEPDEIDLAFSAVRETVEMNGPDADHEQNTVAIMIAHCMNYAKLHGVDWKSAMQEAEEVFETWW